ncbi:heparan sulfate glucosamine 3-O-sulfotransferase 5 [Trichonephila clavipes]|nr:heparan sulfate glucosamine 3-O-sulfotransferase 5 [Trichonephila clavipes]
MSCADAVPDSKDDSFHLYQTDSSTGLCQYSPRPRSNHFFLPESRTFLPFRRSPFIQKGRISSSFCFAFLIFTTSLVFVQLIFLTGGVVTYSPVICKSPLYEGDSEDVSQKIQQKAMTAMAGSDVVQSRYPIFDDFSNICGRISAITRRMLSSKWSSVCGLSA